MRVYLCKNRFKLQLHLQLYLSMDLQNVAGSREANDNPHNYGRFVNDDFTDKNENSDRVGGRKRLSRNMQQQTLVEMWVLKSRIFSDPREFFSVWLIFVCTGTARFTSDRESLRTELCIDGYELLQIHWLACTTNPSIWCHKSPRITIETWYIR